LVGVAAKMSQFDHKNRVVAIRAVTP